VRAVVPIARALLVTIALLAAIDLIFYSAFPHFERLRYSFSAAYLRREVSALHGTSPIIVLGDSVLWGYGVSERESAVGTLNAQDPSWHNLAYVGGSPVNTLAMIRILLAAGIRPREIIFNVNQKQFNVEDSAYQKLYPSVEEVAWGLTPVSDRSELVPVLEETRDARIDRALSTIWQMYGMRSDLRDALFGTSDAAHALQDAVEHASGAKRETDTEHRPTPDKFEGTYDLTPLAKGNVNFDALGEIGAILQRERIPALAILTPTNHRLLHDYIDVPDYGRNLERTRRQLQRYGVRVLNLDARFPADDFIDNDHLTARGNAAFAGILARSVTP
jgi:hypothetical protein